MVSHFWNICSLTRFESRLWQMTDSGQFGKKESSKFKTCLHEIISWIHFTVQCFLRFCFVVKTSADNVIWHIFDIFTKKLSLFSTQLSFYALRKSIGLKKDSIHVWKCQKFAKSRCRPMFLQQNTTSADNVISQIFDIFTKKLSLFSTQLSFYALIKSIGLKKDSIHV